MAEWLSRLIRNQMGSSRASSSLTDCVVFLSEHKLENTKQVQQMFKKNQTVVIITAVRTEQLWPSG